MSEEENMVIKVIEDKVMKLLEDINSKLDKLINMGGSPAAAPKAGSTQIVEESGRKPSALVEKQEAEEKAREKPPVEGRRVCPQCNGTSFKEVEDKSQILHQMGGIKIYAKKHICMTCGFEF